ncbi:N/A [soil metagenome]
MEAQDVLDVLAVLGQDGLDPVLDGGWGIDALLGAQHRDHDDLDLVVPVDQVDRTLSSLASVGFTVAEDLRPTRLALADAADRRIDLHLVAPGADGDLWQEGGDPGGGDLRYPASEVTSGWVGGQPVRCIGATLQAAHHGGYEPRPRDRKDLDLLQRQFGVSPPPGYR